MSGSKHSHMTGREKCNLLKLIRKEIAETNGIVYLTSECTYKGNDCKGTCPKCDAELRYLDAELKRLAEAGTPISLSGLTLNSLMEYTPQQPTLDFDMPISELELSARANCCLKNAGIDTLGILASSSKKDIWNLPNMNRQCMREIQTKLEWLSLSFPDDDEGAFAEMGSVPCVETW